MMGGRRKRKKVLASSTYWEVLAVWVKWRTEPTTIPITISRHDSGRMEDSRS